MRVLLCEDAPRLAEAEAEILRLEGYGVDIAACGERAEELALTGAYGCVLLDIMLPGKSGLDVLASLRAAGEQVPVILLSARTGVDDRVAGLDAGADDYLPKPFHASELLARIRAVTRRPPEMCPSQSVAFGRAELDVAMRVLRLVDDDAPDPGSGLDPGRDSDPGLVPCLDLGPGPAAGAVEVHMTPREAALLEELLRRAPEPAAKADLAARLWGPSSIGGDNRLEVLVHAMRAKLADAGAPCAIQTVRGVGYRWVS